MSRAVLAPAAQTDLRQAVGWIARRDPQAARTLREAVASAAARIGSNPLIGATRPLPGAGRFRFLLLRGFSYIVVYTIDADPPIILWILHTSRDLPRMLSGLD